MHCLSNHKYQMLHYAQDAQIYAQPSPLSILVRVNVIIDSDPITIIAEIQFLLDLMSAFKKKAHKLYSVERKFEVCNFFSIVLSTRQNEFSHKVSL